MLLRPSSARQSSRSVRNFAIFRQTPDSSFVSFQAAPVYQQPAPVYQQQAPVAAFVPQAQGAMDFGGYGNPPVRVHPTQRRGSTEQHTHTQNMFCLVLVGC